MTIFGRWCCCLSLSTQ